MRSTTRRLCAPADPLPLARSHRTGVLKRDIQQKLGEVPPSNFFTKIVALKTAHKLLDKRLKDSKKSRGDEARGRKDHKLTDYDKVELLASILGDNVAQQQRDQYAKITRDPTLTVTLGVVVSLFLSIRKRNMNITNLVHGNMWVERFQGDSSEVRNILVVILLSSLSDAPRMHACRFGQA
jgi:hypothetical protein